MDAHQSPEKDYNLERLIFLSDGVFAIVITLLALELRLPDVDGKTLVQLLEALARPLAAFAVAFAVVGMFWIWHRNMFARVIAFKPGLAVLNLFFLGLVTLLPFATSLVYDTESEPTAALAVLFVLLIMGITIAQAVLWGYATLAANVVRADLTPTQKWGILVLMLASSGLLGVWAFMLHLDRPMREWLLVALGLLAARTFVRRLEKGRKRVEVEAAPQVQS